MSLQDKEIPVLSDKWIDDILKKSFSVKPGDDFETKLCEELVHQSYALEIAGIRRGKILAAAFDLLIAAQYYSALSHSDWLYSPGKIPRLFFHYTNCCPRSVLSNNFYFNPSKKPTSGKIGAATGRLLLFFLQQVLKYNNRPEIVLRGTEPVDTVIVNHETRHVLFAEIKASPLLTPAISVRSQLLTRENEGLTVPRGYSSVDNVSLFSEPLEIFVPSYENGQWVEGYFPLGSRENIADVFWAHKGLLALLTKNTSFFEAYVAFWLGALDAYHPRRPRDIFWLTNACGTPSPIPQDWPQRRVGEGFESVSDSKTSVGMDRTDDIKKGIYQVLKLGAEGKATARKWNYKIGLLSNIHPARHFDEYLHALKDVVWTFDLSRKAKKIGDLPSEQPLYNLFDGIIAFTETFARDEWIEEVFRPLNGADQ